MVKGIFIAAIPIAIITIICSIVMIGSFWGFNASLTPCLNDPN